MAFLGLWLSILGAERLWLDKDADKGYKSFKSDMNALTVDSSTGFLTSNNINAFTAEKKVEFLAIARKYADAKQLPDVGEMCDKLEVDYNTFTSHLRNDEVFREEWEKLKKRTYHGLAHELSIKANTKGGIIANLAVLKYLERGKFSDDPDSNNDSDYGLIKRLADALSVNKPPVISTDAEIVKPNTNVLPPSEKKEI